MPTDTSKQHEMERALNSLISTLLDSQKGFADIGEHLKDDTLKRYFLAESLKRASSTTCSVDKIAPTRSDCGAV